MKINWLPSVLLLGTQSAWSRQIADFEVQRSEFIVEGWHGFTDFDFLANAFITLTLAAVLGAVIAYHPKRMQSADTLEELQAPKVFILYAVMGSLIGIMVVKYGLIIGFVLFGIGGLIRFRTVFRSTSLTGHIIFVTLIGLSCGLELPHVAVLATVFGFGLIYILDARVTYRIDIRALRPELVAGAAAAYRGVLEQQGCRIINEKKNPAKERVSFIFRTTSDISREHLDDLFDEKIDLSLRGSLDWEID